MNYGVSIGQRLDRFTPGTDDPQKLCKVALGGFPAIQLPGTLFVYWEFFRSGIDFAKYNERYPHYPSELIEFMRASAVQAAEYLEKRKAFISFDDGYRKFLDLVVVTSGSHCGRLTDPMEIELYEQLCTLPSISAWHAMQKMQTPLTDEEAAKALLNMIQQKVMLYFLYPRA
ncbi:MAG: hypothetical protein FWD25_01065 [Clostridia bacterium]|nr:hypothetical protein [Clostridia bacterium]